MSKKPTVLMILDGFGLNEQNRGNAVAQANTPNIDDPDERLSVCQGLCKWSCSWSS